MITVVKQDPLGNQKLRYEGELLERSPTRMVIQAPWTLAPRDLGYIVFEPGDIFTEYYYTNRWFNIFDVVAANGLRKGWYCNVAAPALFLDTLIEQVDLLLDVWVSPTGSLHILDEDEFAADTSMSEEQRAQARAGLDDLLRFIEAREDAFAELAR